ncbi:MAG: hypothetical protein ACRCTE_10075 [Cellulosilyticaceae bacterium]
MDYVLMIVLAIVFVIYPRTGIYIDKFKVKALGLEVEISAKEKSAPPSKCEHSNRK